jgi:hypothetical protein
MDSPAKAAATYLNYAAELLNKASEAEGEDKRRLVELAAKWRKAAEQALDKAEPQTQRRSRDD